MARVHSARGFWLSDLTEAQRRILDIMRRTDPELGVLSAEVAQSAGLARTDYATARLRALAVRGLVRRHETEAQRWHAIPSAYEKMEPLA